MEKTNVTSKITELFPILDTHFKGKINRPRLKLMPMFVIALCKIQTIGFEKLSKVFDSVALLPSSLRRILWFNADFILDADLIAKMIFSFLLEKENHSLCSNCLSAERKDIGDRWTIHLNNREIRYLIRIEYFINFY